MALLADKSADAGSNLVQGKGTNSLAFPMPGNVQLDVESVVATIDNTAGGDTFATLVVRDVSGEVIATKRQSEAIPAGDTGTATWSLRDTDSSGASTATGFIKYHFANTGDWLIIEGTGAYPGSFLVGGQTAAWAVGIDGNIVGVGASGAFASLILSSENTATLRSDAQLNLTAVGDIVATSDTTTNNVSDFFDVNAGNSVTVTAQNGGGTGSVNIDPDKLSFFGVPAVAQAATPVTLGDVIALLRAYGLAA